MEAEGSSETVALIDTTGRHISEDRTLHTNHSENLKSQSVKMTDSKMMRKTG
jgi:hypothetical protein